MHDLESSRVSSGNLGQIERFLAKNNFGPIEFSWSKSDQFELNFATNLINREFYESKSGNFRPNWAIFCHPVLIQA